MIDSLDLGLKEKVAIIAGAGAKGDGIGNGRAAAILLAEAGAKVVVADKDQELADRTVQMISERKGNAASVAADLTKASDCEKVVEYAKQIKPSHRGELEITDLNNMYLEDGNLKVELMGRGCAWLDTGTQDSLLEAANFIAAIEKRQGLKICCPEEIAFRQGFINAKQLETLARPLVKSGYGTYLMQILEDKVKA